MSESRTLVLVRHGETDWNASGRAQGHTDVPLNAVGRVQAREVARELARLEADRLWSSDLLRAVQTAEAIADVTGLPVEKDARLREYDVGERAGLTIAEFAVEFPEEHAAWQSESEELLVPGAESTAQVRDRILPCLQEIWGALAPGRTGIAVLHGACLKIGLMGLLDWSWDLRDSLQGMENCGYAVLTDSGRRGQVRLASYNQTAGGPRPRPDFVADAPVG